MEELNAERLPPFALQGWVGVWLLISVATPAAEAADDDDDNTVCLWYDMMMMTVTFVTGRKE